MAKADEFDASEPLTIDREMVSGVIPFFVLLSVARRILAVVLKSHATLSGCSRGGA